MGDHTESIQIDFDPATLPYQRLLELFWSSHSPCSRSYGTQYRNALFTHSDAQHRVALATKEALEAKMGTIHTAIEPLREFFVAEDYHQKYYLRGEEALARELMAVYTAPRDFMNSTAAARLNAWVSSGATREQLDHDLPRMGLSASTVTALRRRLN
jgi:peptide-methionine (S)-S-oxide reductase